MSPPKINYVEVKQAFLSSRSGCENPPEVADVRCEPPHSSAGAEATPGRDTLSNDPDGDKYFTPAFLCSTSSLAVHFTDTTAFYSTAEQNKFEIFL